MQKMRQYPSQGWKNADNQQTTVYLRRNEQL